VKIAQVLDEADWANKATNLGKRKFEFDNRQPKGKTPKGLTLMDPMIRGSNRCPSRTKLPVTPTVNFMVACAD